MSNRKKYNNVHLWDVAFYKTDDDGNELLNKDGSIMLFTAPALAFSSVLEEVEELDDVEYHHLVQVNNGRMV